MPVPLKYNIRNLWMRRVTTLLTIFGIALVTFVFVTMFAYGIGMDRALVGSGHPLNVITLRTGTVAESQSLVTKEQVDDIIGLPGVPKDARGEPLVSAELVVVANIVKQDGKKANAAIRGVGPQAKNVRDNITILPGGRWFSPALGEIVVGAGAARRFKDLKVGDRPFFRGRQWSVVGHFTADGQAYESELWADINDLKAQFKREFSAVLIRCEKQGEVDRLSAAIKNTKKLKLDAKPHLDYYKDQNMGANMIKVMSGVMGLVLSVGAIFGAANTMYAAVASRTREIATMRVLGFSRLSIWASFLLESALLGMVGGVLGSLMAFFLFNNMSTGTVNWQSFSELAFQFRVTPELMAAGTLLAAVMGMAGGFLPSYRASRMTIARALRGL